MDEAIKPRLPVVRVASEIVTRKQRESERTMRFRFSLRRFFILITLLAGFCYCWFVMPTVTAKRFVEAIAAKDYGSADQLFTDSSSRFIADSADKFWAFEATANLLPITAGQLLRGERHVRLQHTYFYLDEHVNLATLIRANSIGLRSSKISQQASAVTIERETGLNPLPRR